MFNFNELKKLKFGEVFENIGSTTPKGNTGVYDTQEYNNVMTGAILCIGSAIASTIISILLILGIAALFFEIPLGETDLSVSLDVVMIGVLIYTVVNKTKAHNSWFEYIVSIIAMVGILGDLFGMLAAVITIIVNPVYAILLEVILVADIIGRLFIMMGYQSFSKRLRDEYNKQHVVMPTGTIEAQVGAVQPQASQAPVPPVAVVPVQQKTCPYCGNAVNTDAKFCKTCGANVQ